MYKTLNIKEEFSRCLVLEWRYKSEKFSCYVIHPSNMKDDNVRFAVDDDRPNSFDRETFLNAFYWYDSKDETLRTIGLGCLQDIESWFFKASIFYTNMSDDFIRELNSRKLTYLF